MQKLLAFSRFVDRASERLGALVCWLTLAMVLLGAANAFLRHVGRMAGQTLVTNAFFEGQWYLFSLVFLLGAAVTLKRDKHVRVDVFYGRRSRRARAWIDVTGTVVFLVPFCVFAIASSVPMVHESWRNLEMSSDPGGLPRFPLKTMIPVAFSLLLLQGVSGLIKSIDFLRSGEAVGSPGEASDPAHSEPALVTEVTDG